LAENPEGWPHWFTAVRQSGYAGSPPYGVGTGRVIRLRGGVRFVETVIAWDRAERYAYRVEETNAPGVRALVEEWRLTPAPDGSGSEVTWTMALDCVPPMGLLLGLARTPMKQVFARAAALLDERAGRRGIPTQPTSPSRGRPGTDASGERNQTVR
jgi:hypothetical protein